MLTLPRLTARLGAVASCALLLAACNPDSKGLSSLSGPTLSANREGSSKSSGGSSSGFAVLGKAAVSCTDGTIIGNVGTDQTTPPGAITLVRCPVTGTTHIGDAAAIAAYNAFLAQYGALAPKLGDVCPIIAGTLAGQTFAPGVYCVSAEAKTGVVTLNGPANGTWVFKVAASASGATGALTGTNFSVNLAGGAQACNVTWWVSQAATMTTSAFQGNILAGAAISMTGGTLNGNAWAGASGVGDVTFTGTAVTGCKAGAGRGGDEGEGEEGEHGEHGERGHHGEHDEHGDRGHDRDSNHERGDNNGGDGRGR